PSTVMFDAESSESWMNRMRSSSVNIVCLCRGWRTTATITRSNRPDARRITSRWPVVTGSYVPGQTAIVSGMGEDGEAGAAVCALGQRRQGQLGGGAGGVGLEHGAAAGREQRRQLGGEAIGQGRQHLVGRIEEYQVVCQARGRVRREPAATVLTADGATVSVPEPGRVLPQHRERRSVKLAEGDLRRTPGERLEAERPAAREGIEDVRACDVGQDREERLAHPVGRRSG